MANTYNNLPVPANGQRIEVRDGKFIVPDRPIIPFVEGDGTGRDIWKASVRVFDAAVQKAYGGKRQVVWYEVFAGEKAMAKFGEWLPKDTTEHGFRLHFTVNHATFISFCDSRGRTLCMPEGQYLAAPAFVVDPKNRGASRPHFGRRARGQEHLPNAHGSSKI